MIFIYSARLGHLTLQPCCALTNGPFLAFLMAQINYLDLGNQQQLQIWKLVGYFRNCDILKIGCFWQNPKIHENWRCQNWLFWPFSISNLCHRQTIRDRPMKPNANDSLGSQFLQEKSPRWKYKPIFEKTPWPNLAVQNSKFAAHVCPGWRRLC